jgi:hypothetical protein
MNTRSYLRPVVLSLVTVPLFFWISVSSGADLSSLNFTIVRGAVLSGGGNASSPNFSQSYSVSSPTATTDATSTSFSLAGVFPALPDADGDVITDNIDNCLEVVNSNQRDTDRDGFGNRCDGDLNNDGSVNILDLGLFKQRFTSTDANADFNGDGNVDILDLGLFKQMFNKPPGPSASIP